MKILEGKEQEYKDWYEKNSDPYGRACFRYAERWAGLLEKKIAEEMRDHAVEFELFGTCSDYVEVNHAIEAIKRGGIVEQPRI